MNKSLNLGSVNPCNYAVLLGGRGKVYGWTLDAPNAIAYAMAHNPKIKKAVAHYPMFGDKVTMRTDVEDRFWFVRDDIKLAKHLKLA